VNRVVSTTTDRLLGFCELADRPVCVSLTGLQTAHIHAVSVSSKLVKLGNYSIGVWPYIAFKSGKFFEHRKREMFAPHTPPTLTEALCIAYSHLAAVSDV